VGRDARYPDLYEVLGAPRDAAPDELEAAYRARVTTVEPVPQEVADAYAVLSEERSRTLYNRLALAETSVIAASPEPITPTEPREAPAVRDDRVVRWIAAAALLLSLVFLVAILLAQD
jgi:curved DNA-binding protein CbpA